MKTKQDGGVETGGDGGHVLAVLCCLLLENPALRALPDMSKLRTRVCVRADTIDACTRDTTRRDTSGGHYGQGLLQLTKRVMPLPRPLSTETRRGG